MLVIRQQERKQGRDLRNRNKKIKYKEETVSEKDEAKIEPSFVILEDKKIDLCTEVRNVDG